MADHIISLSNTREAALQKLLDVHNSLADPPLTKDELIRLWVLTPIKAQIRQDRAASSESLQSAYENATTQVQDQVKALLGITLP